MSTPEHDQGDADDLAAARHVELGQELGDGEAGGHRRERRSVPGEERALVGEGEPRVDRGRFLGRLVDGLHARDGQDAVVERERDSARAVGPATGQHERRSVAEQATGSEVASRPRRSGRRSRHRVRRIGADADSGPRWRRRSVLSGRSHVVTAVTRAVQVHGPGGPLDRWTPSRHVDGRRSHMRSASSGTMMALHGPTCATWRGDALRCAPRCDDARCRDAGGPHRCRPRLAWAPSVSVGIPPPAADRSASDRRAARAWLAQTGRRGDRSHARRCRAGHRSHGPVGRTATELVAGVRPTERLRPAYQD